MRNKRIGFKEISKKVGWEGSMPFPTFSVVKNLYEAFKRGNVVAACDLVAAFRFTGIPQNENEQYIANLLCDSLEEIRYIYG